jgi:hypothetical protein
MDKVRKAGSRAGVKVLGGSRSNAGFVAAPSTNRGASNTPPSGAALSTTGGLLGGGTGSANDAWSADGGSANGGNAGGGSANGGSPSPMNEATARVLTRPNESTLLNDKIDLNLVRVGVKRSRQVACTANA